MSQALGAALLFLTFAAALRAGLAWLRGKTDWGRAALGGAQDARARDALMRDGLGVGLLLAAWGLSFAPHPAALIAAGALGLAGAAAALNGAMAQRRRMKEAPRP